ncbi:hypothetical protein ACFWF7_24275 [Nocardia sp. NPDC060256]|uniref:hypothetical protein n=1 Tax=unclassified Nocardia TaxID=2637762 RepID=UPI00365644EF
MAAEGLATRYGTGSGRNEDTSMGDSGKRLGVDLYELEQAAKGDFPQIALDYSIAIGSCNSVADGLAQVLERPAYFGGSTQGPVYDAYRALHTTVVGFLTDTQKNLEDTATALDKAAQYFAGIDREAGDEMNRRMHDDPALSATQDPPKQNRPGHRMYNVQ